MHIFTFPNVSWTGDIPRQSPPAEPSAESTNRWSPTDAQANEERGESHARFLHVAEPGAMVRKSGRRIRVLRGSDVLFEFPAAKLQGVFLYGNAQVSTQSLRTMLQEGVWFALLSREGRYLGRLQPAAEGGGRMRHLQWDRLADPVFRLRFSQAVIRGKTHAQRRIASGYAKNYPAEAFTDSRRVLDAALDRLAACETVDQVRGVEGAATRAYFELFRRWNKSPFPFEERVKRGANDPINILLNLGYTMLTLELSGILEGAGLDPAIGYLHNPDDNRPSLACDWVEEFRHVVTDRIVLNLINKGSIVAADFQTRDDGAVRLAPNAVRKFVGAYERAMIGGKAKDEVEQAGESPAGYRAIFLRQLARLLDAIRDGEGYTSHLEAA